MPVAGGLFKGIERIASIQGTALQIFTRNQRQWKVPEITSQDLERFRAVWRSWGSHPIAAHDSYLINLANPDPDKARQSVEGFAMELGRCARLDIGMLVTHPGSHLGQGMDAGLRRYTQNLDQALDLALNETSNLPLVLLETTAGQGTNLGSRFEELAEIISLSKHPDQLGVCFDTCHAFCAGYDFTTPESYTKTFAEFDQLMGLERIKLFHLNDSKNPLGSRKDRHEHIGKGCLGLAPFRLLLNDPHFKQTPMILETPKDKGGRDVPKGP